MSVCLVLTIDVYVPTYLPKFSCVCKISKKGLSQLFCFNSKGTKKRRRIRFDCFLSLRFVFKIWLDFWKIFTLTRMPKTFLSPMRLSRRQRISLSSKKGIFVSRSKNLDIFGVRYKHIVVKEDDVRKPDVGQAWAWSYKYIFCGNFTLHHFKPIWLDDKNYRPIKMLEK